MTIKIVPSHVAILVPSVRKAANYLRKFNFQVGDEEIWDGEGTREIYIERDKGNSLLLMEPTKPGAYQRAMDKRGPGLHHLAIDVLDVESYIESLVGSGWLLHPKSLKTFKQNQAAYLARPGFPALIEVQECKELLDRQIFVESVYLPMDFSLFGLVRSIYAQTVDILPDIEKNELHVRVHNAANQASDKTVEAICKELTATETIFPGTDLKLVYSLVSQKNI